MVFLGSRVFLWREHWKSCELHHFPPSHPARSVCSCPRAARVQKQLLASGRGTRWRVPRITQISGRSPLTPSRSKGLRVDRAECCLRCPSRIPLHSCSGRCCLEHGPGKPQDFSQVARQHLCVFLIPGRWPSGVAKPEAWAGPPFYPPSPRCCTWRALLLPLLVKSSWDVVLESRVTREADLSQSWLIPAS